jgi:phosphoglycolate phosphatase
MMYYKNLIFDLDGTLVDSLPGIEEALLKSIQMVIPDRVRDLPDIRKFIGPPLNVLVKQLLPDISEAENNHIIANFRAIYDDKAWERTLLYEHVISTLAWLKQHYFNCFLATNKRYRPTQQIVNRLGLIEYFNDIVTPDNEKTEFSSKEIMIKYLIKKHKLDFNSTILIGDTNDDAIAAKKCGISFIVAVYGYGGLQAFDNIHSIGKIKKIDDLCQILGS